MAPRRQGRLSAADRIAIRRSGREVVYPRLRRRRLPGDTGAPEYRGKAPIASICQLPRIDEDGEAGPRGGFAAVHDKPAGEPPWRAYAGPEPRRGGDVGLVNGMFRPVRKGTVFRIPGPPTARAQELWGKKPVFRGVFRIPEQHENILGATQKLHGLTRRQECHERHADKHLIGSLVIEPDLPLLLRLRWPGGDLLIFWVSAVGGARHGIPGSAHALKAPIPSLSS